MPRRTRRLVALSALAALSFVSASPLPAAAEDASKVRADEQVEFARDQVYPALVNIGVVSTGFSGGRMERYPSAGSGVIVSPAGHVLTNFHVAGDSTRLYCRLPSKEQIEAEVVVHDPLTDLSVIKLNSTRGATATSRSRTRNSATRPGSASASPSSRWAIR